MMVDKQEYFQVEVQTIDDTVWHIWAKKDTLDDTEKVIKSLRSMQAQSHSIKNIRVMKVTEYKEQLV